MSNDDVVRMSRTELERADKASAMVHNGVSIFTPSACEVCAQPIGHHLWADMDINGYIVACSNQCQYCGGTDQCASWCDPND